MTIRIDDIVKGGGGERGKDKSVVEALSRNNSSNYVFGVMR